MEKEVPMRVDPNDWSAMSEEEYREYLRALKSSNDGYPIFLNSGRNLTFTIKDGDYTLQEGVDYKTCYYRGTDDVSWVVLLVGIGKYKRTLFYGAEMGFPVEEETLQYQEEPETFSEHIRSAIERYNGDVFD